MFEIMVICLLWFLAITVLANAYKLSQILEALEALLKLSTDGFIPITSHRISTDHFFENKKKGED